MFGFPVFAAVNTAALHVHITSLFIDTFALFRVTKNEIAGS